MHEHLAELIDAYQMAVSEALAAFLDSGLCPRPDSRVAWGANGLPQRGDVAGGGRYRKLAYGLAIERNGMLIEFDFASDGRSDGFDEHRLTQFWERHQQRVQRRGFASVEEVRSAFGAAVRAKALRPLGGTLYCLA